MKLRDPRLEPDVKKIEPEDMDRVPFGKGEKPGGGAAAAQGALPPEGSSEVPPSTPPSDGSGALALVEMALGLAVQFVARKSKLPPEDYSDLRKLSEDERELLKQFAPAAEPYLGMLASNAPQVGAAIFAAAFALIAFGRLTELRDRARARGPAKPERSEDTHRALFGAAASNIPRSTRIHDEGKFPPAFTPAEPIFQTPFVPSPSASPDPLTPIPA